MGHPEALAPFTNGPGWAAFADPEQYFRAALVLLAATLSGAVLAYHPVYRGRGVTLETIEQRKTIIIYSSVGALIAIICTVAPSMAFVIFGIGGLMRFRTNTGESTATGQTIMSTLVGLCWGLGLQLVAALATVYFWIMIYLLELAATQKIMVGIEIASMQRAAELYREALLRAGCRVLAHGKNFPKAQMNFVIRMPRGVDQETVQQQLSSIPPEYRGTIDWRD